MTEPQGVVRADNNGTAGDPPGRVVLRQTPRAGGRGGSDRPGGHARARPRYGIELVEPAGAAALTMAPGLGTAFLCASAGSQCSPGRAAPTAFDLPFVAWSSTFGV